MITTESIYCWVNLPRKMRYYQGMPDITFFPAGVDYNLMRKSYVIFIRNFDPYDEGLDPRTCHRKHIR
jgi:hypothetical protein